MKGKIRILMLAVMFIGCVSCNKDIPGAPEAEGQEVTIKAALNVGEVVATRSDANDAEKTIGNKMIFVFNESGACTGLSVGVDTVKAKSGNVKVVGIANPEDALVKSLKAAYDKGTLTYQSLSGSVTNQQLAEASNLIKIGVTETMIAPTTDLNDKPVVNIQVAHLPSRVTVKVEAEGGTFDIKTYDVSGIATQSYLSVGLPALKSELKEDANVSGVTPLFYTYKKETASNPIQITITGTLTKDSGSEEPKTYLLTLNPTTDNGGTDGILPGYAYTVTGNIKNGDIGVRIKVEPMTPCPVDVEYGGDDSKGPGQKNEDNQ